MGNRKHGIIDELSPELKWTVEQMLLSGSTYSEIVDYLGQHDVPISIASVCRWARAYNASAQMLAVAQQNFKRLMDQMDQYPDLDTTEAMIRLASQNVINALVNTSEEEWDKMDKDKLLSSALGLVRAAAYKKKTDAALKDDAAAGLDAVKDMAFSAMAKERPDLYKEVAAYLKTKKKEAGGPDGRKRTKP